MKKLSLIIATLVLIFAVTMLPASASTEKPSPERDETVDVPVDGDADQKPDGDVVSPDTSDTLTNALVCLAMFDASLVAVYFLTKKVKAN